MINETLVAAAQYMDEHGKAVGLYRDERNGSVCMMGAINAALFPNYSTSAAEEFKAARDRLAAYCATTMTPQELAEYPGTDSPIFYLNDFVHQSKEETVKFMLEAAEWEPKE